jgi:hypothetical protein
VGCPPSPRHPSQDCGNYPSRPMELRLSIDSKGINKASAWLAKVEKQLPFAASRALNDSAKKAAAALNQSTNQYFDRPTRFTQSGYRVSSFSNKKTLEAQLRPKPIQERYLLPSITGGIRPQRPSERKLGGIAPAWSPGLDARRNASGNMSKAAVVKALQGGGNNFRIKNQQGNLRPGVYQRMKRGAVKSILSFNRLPSIPKRWPVERIALASLNASWAPLLNKYMEEALRTAK